MTLIFNVQRSKPEARISSKLIVLGHVHRNNAMVTSTCSLLGGGKVERWRLSVSCGMRV